MVHIEQISPSFEIPHSDIDRISEMRYSTTVCKGPYWLYENI
ncbi:MAG: hypothetical protein R6U17_03365 [Thermoplasmata archaeon]